MKTHSIIKSAVLGLFLSAFVATGLFAQDAKGGAKGGHGKGQKMEQALAKLDLTEAQKAEIERLKEAFKAKNEGAIEEIKDLREKMRQQQQDGDKEGAKATREQIKTKRQALKEGSGELMEQISAVLKSQFNGAQLIFPGLLDGLLVELR